MSETTFNSNLNMQMFLIFFFFWHCCYVSAVASERLWHWWLNNHFRVANTVIKRVCILINKNNALHINFNYRNYWSFWKFQHSAHCSNAKTLVKLWDPFAHPWLELFLSCKILCHPNGASASVTERCLRQFMFASVPCFTFACSQCLREHNLRTKEVNVLTVVVIIIAAARVSSGLFGFCLIVRAKILRIFAAIARCGRDGRE